MLKSISKLGTVLSKLEQKIINGGALCRHGYYYHCEYVTVNGNSWWHCECKLPQAIGDEENG